MGGIYSGLPMAQQVERVRGALTAEWQSVAGIAEAAQLTFDQVATICRTLFRWKEAEKLKLRRDAAPLYRKTGAAEERAS